MAKRYVGNGTKGGKPKVKRKRPTAVKVHVLTSKQGRKR